jgi:hypothetical protein
VSSVVVVARLIAHMVVAARPSCVRKGIFWLTVLATITTCHVSVPSAVVSQTRCYNSHGCTNPASTRPCTRTTGLLVPLGRRPWALAAPMVEYVQPSPRSRKPTILGQNSRVAPGHDVLVLGGTRY